MLRRFITPSITIKRHSSALYVTGDRAKEQCAVLTPYLKFDDRLSNLDELKDNIQRRKLSINLDDVSTEYSMFKAVNDKKAQLEKRKKEIAEMFKSKKPSIDNVEGLQIQARMLRDDLKILKENSYFLEGQFVHNYLKLPNLLHKCVPDKLEIVYEFKKELINESLQMTGTFDDCIEFFDSSCVYLKGEASKFELFMPMRVIQSFNLKSYTNFSNPDFVRSVIAQGAGLDSDELFLVREDDIENKLNQLHLTGNGSFVNYLGYITKLTTYPTLFPMKFISTGRQYQAKNHRSHQDLYNSVQSTCVQTFAADVNGDAFDEIIGEHVDRFKKIFEPFNQHFRIVTVPADQLHPTESFKIAAEMFSPSKQCYIEVGNVSYYHDFISKRLLFNYKEGKVTKFPHIYSGTVVNVLKLFLVLMENEKSFKCPEWLVELE